ncbi:hypothetical protein EG329_003155 [Mollisiaceae sp. DMI_Dod_QoI]|nr:hypothetical protein EG329_003155 [Helotiales sp. DMI_Dod_QoI]
MASRSVSPGGALLRASRVFAIPPALPRPMGDLSAQAIFNSDTATLPHPTHLSITTPQSSRARGDWGFKRPLPLRSTTKTSTPFIRVEAIDTFEHITEFGSSADHALSLQKWQEMGVPLTIPLTKNTRNYEHEERKSVFEDDIDSTIESDNKFSKTDTARWNYKGPWLAGMTEGDFNTYITRQVQDKKSDFRKFLREACARSLTAEARRKAVGEEELPAAIQTEDVTEEQMTEYVKILRHDRSELYGLIRAFLDLPPAPTVQVDDYANLISEALSRGATGPNDTYDINTGHAAISASPYAKTGPPKTHPSAGLAYSRTNAHIYNHPEFGPQRSKAPIKARVVLPGQAAVGNFAPKLGVGGFVTEVPDGELGGFKQRPVGRAWKSAVTIPGMTSIEPDKKGGSKAYVEPLHAQVDPSGRVILKVAIAQAEAVAVQEGTTDRMPDPTRNIGSMRPAWKSPEGLQEAAVAGSQFAMSYGLRSPGARRNAMAEDAAAKQAREQEASKELASMMKDDELPF